MGLLSDGGVHSHNTHLFALLELAKRSGLAADQVIVHAILDGRDTPPRSGAGYLEQLEQQISGRRYWTHRDRHRPLLQHGPRQSLGAHRARVRGVRAGPRVSASAVHKRRFRASYAADTGDEFVEPTVIVDYEAKPIGRVRDGDAIIFFNFRPDRARQITRAFTHSAPEGAAKPPVDVQLRVHDRVRQHDPHARGLSVRRLSRTPLARWSPTAGLRQLRIAETEKYAHVTYFFNGGREIRSSTRTAR